ncbi:alpha/beta hydrolase [Streptomyces sp. ISL-24]|uniref:alpha/beta hydrolase n=1 Tax=unclassified Streptomyces TaxID=2593676 RepID=UPI0035AB6DB4
MTRVARWKRTGVSLVLSAVAVLGAGSWTAGVTQAAVTGPAPGAAAWRADRVLGMSLPDPATAAPSRVAGFFAGLDTRERDLLARRHPLTVGNLDGAPVELRYRANERALRAEYAAQVERSTDASLLTRERELAAERADRVRRLLADGRRILAFDPRGRGQVAEVFGDLARARHVAVVVPGSDADLMFYDGEDADAADPYVGWSGRARSLYERMTADAPGTPVAVVVWVGYTTPVGLGVDAATDRLAEAGAPRLDRFLAGLAAVGIPVPAVLCHSYGSVVCGLAAPRADRHTVSDLVLFGSPGVRAGSAADLGTDATVWAARAPSDWVRTVAGLHLLDLGHGTDPVGRGFGARRFCAANVRDHGGYFAPDSDALRAFSAIALGRPVAPC